MAGTPEDEQVVASEVAGFMAASLQWLRMAEEGSRTFDPLTCGAMSIKLAKTGLEWAYGVRR